MLPNDKSVSLKQKHVIQVVTFLLIGMMLLAVFYILSFGAFVHFSTMEYNRTKNFATLDKRMDEMDFWFAPIIAPAKKKKNERYRAVVYAFSRPWVADNFIFLINVNQN